MMKPTWVVCALLANMPFERAKATQISQTESRHLDGSLMQLVCCPAKGCANSAASDSSSSSSSSSEAVQESDEEPEQKRGHTKKRGAHEQDEAHHPEMPEGLRNAKK